MKGMVRREIKIQEENGARDFEQLEHVVALGRALSDPIRVQMLGMLVAEAAEVADAATSRTSAHP
jgi:hypothetical protein